MRERRSVLAELADILTLFRGIGILFILFGFWLRGVDSWSLLANMVAAGWMSDMLDGTLARQANQPSWIGGENEIVFDLLFLIGVGFYMIFAFPIPAIAKGVLFFWIVLSVAAIYAQVHNRYRSFVPWVESPTAIVATLAIFICAWYYEKNDGTTFVIGMFTGMGILNLLRGFEAGKEVRRRMRLVKDELKRVFAFLKPE